MLNLNEIGKYTEIKELKEIDQLEINELAESLNRLTLKHMNQFDRDQVFKILKRLEHWSPISYEWLQYLLLTSNGFTDHNKVVSSINSFHSKKLVRTRLNKIKKIIKSRTNLKVTNKNKITKQLQSIKGSLRFVRGRKTYHFLDLKPKKTDLK